MTNFLKRLFFQISIFLLIAGAGIIGLLFFGSSIKNYVNKIYLTRQEIALRSSELASLAILKSQYNSQAKDYLNILEQKIPTRDQMIELPKNLKPLADHLNLEMSFTFTGETSPSTTSFGFANFSLNVKGTGDSLNQFFQELTKSQPLIIFDNLNFDRLNEQEQILVHGRAFFR